MKRTVKIITEQKVMYVISPPLFPDARGIFLPRRHASPTPSPTTLVNRSDVSFQSWRRQWHGRIPPATLVYARGPAPRRHKTRRRSRHFRDRHLQTARILWPQGNTGYLLPAAAPIPLRRTFSANVIDSIQEATIPSLRGWLG